MLSFLRAQAFEDPLLGRFKRVGTMWVPEKPPNGLCVTMEGGKEGPSQKTIELALSLLRDPDTLVNAAAAYVHTDSKALEFVQGNGKLVCDGFTVYQSEAFAVEFSLSSWPDAMISVPFVGGVPSRVTLSD